MIKDSIALIGFMATGKTKIGKELAKHLGADYRFIELDQEIIRKAGKSISKIFKEEGEKVFRQYEIDVCRTISNLKKVVISCGGGVVLEDKNIKNLKRNCHIVLLSATIDEIYDRVMKNGKEKRPLIDKDDPKKEIVHLLQIRNNYYESAAEIKIDTTNKKIEDIIGEIIIKLKRINN